jgi:hypothetical protein
MRSLLLVESLELRPSNQYILVSESEPFTVRKNVCVPGKAAVEMKSKVFDMVLLRSYFIGSNLIYYYGHRHYCPNTTTTAASVLLFSIYFSIFTFLFCHNHPRVCI